VRQAVSLWQPECNVLTSQCQIRVNAVRATQRRRILCNVKMTTLLAIAV
jgi:hypothetical protein